MPETKDFGRFYLHRIRLRRGSALIHRAVTQEIDFPFRVGRSLIIRFWREHGLVLGRWGAPAASEDQAMARAIGAREEKIFGPARTLLSRYRRADQAADTGSTTAGTRLDPQVLHRSAGRADADRDARAGHP